MFMWSFDLLGLCFRYCPSSQYLRFLVPNTIKGGTRNLKCWVLGPYGFLSAFISLLGSVLACLLMATRTLGLRSLGGLSRTMVADRALPGTQEIPTWTSKSPKIMDPILPVLSILGYWAIILGFLEVQVYSGRCCDAMCGGMRL